MVAAIVLIPVGIVRRYQVGTSRQRARGWLATVNVIGFSASSGLLVGSAVVMSFWVTDALIYTVVGLATGAGLGMAGLWLTRWERTPGALHYTPNRLLILTISLVVIGRLGYGLWRAWASARRGISGEAWLVDAGVAGSMAAGALVLGYYLVFWIGIRRRVRRG